MDQFIQLAHQHAWAPLSILVMLWIYRALADDSKFPITWPEKWRKYKPLVLITFGQAICVVKAISFDHTMWYVAVTNGIIISFMALGGVHLLRLWWPVEGSEPAWLRALVLVFGKVVDIVPVVVTNIEPQPTTLNKSMMLDEEGLPTKEPPPPPEKKK